MDMLTVHIEPHILPMAELLAARSFVSFASLQATLDLDYAVIISLKEPVETFLRCADDDIRLISQVHLDPPGFFVDC